MHLPTATRRRIVLATAAVVVCGSTVFTWNHFAGAAASAHRKALAASGVHPELADLAHTSKDAPKGAAAAGQAQKAGSKEQQQPREKISTYTVAEGDTIGGIAERLGLKAQSILMTNNLSEDDLIQPGQKLLIPAVDGAVVEVESGDTLWGLAQDYGVSEVDIVNANPDVSPENLALGAKLLIPGAKPIQHNQLASRGSSNARSSHKLAWPTTGPITDPFGWRIHPVYGTKSFHDGMDIGVPEGTPLAAAAGGTVIMAGRYSSYGITVRIDHGNGLVTMYAHMSEVAVSVGERVAAGDLIGYSGNTGVSTGPHLHFTVIEDGNPVDPIDWLP